MNIMFWGLLILMLLLAIGLLVFPLLKVRAKTAVAYKESNLRINEDKVMELDLDLEEGRIDQGFYNAAREELDRELLIDIPEESKSSAALHYTAAAERHPAVAILIALFVPMLALLLYLDLGMHAASDEVQIAHQPSSQQEPSIEEMIVQLEQRIEAQGGTAEEWTMLGRAHKYKGDNEQAAKAFAVALENDTDNVQLMLERAEVLALNNNRLFNGESRALVMKAYTLDPENPNVLWFAGVAEFQAGEFRNAITHLTKLLPMAGGEEEVMQSIVSIVQKSRQALVALGEEMPELDQILILDSSVSKADLSIIETAQASVRSLQITVSVSDQVRKRFKENDVVFVYAKAKRGPRMPLAAERLIIAALPATIVLDDSMAMVEGMNLSAFNELVISARVSKTSSAITQSGDYIGQRDVKGEDSDVSIVIDTIVP